MYYYITGSASTTPSSTRANSPIEEITIPATVENTNSSEIDAEELTENIELDVGEEEGNTDGSKRSTEMKTTCKESQVSSSVAIPTTKEKEKECKKKISYTNNEESPIPEKKSKLEGSNRETSHTNIPTGMRSMRVKPGTSLLLKRK